ncbi:hypothetical protein JOF35_000844 [Streptomyces demainii]|uniref:Uncharacterized protein n=1 Tax=Streptomyces demainii TaxID=588122 RepID=A0ABT9KJG6_9ACTN|nr:hypothetical protein [Streptomyces demainii]
MTGAGPDKDSTPVRTKGERAAQALTLIARASQAVYWVYKLCQLL